MGVSIAVARRQAVRGDLEEDQPARNASARARPPPKYQVNEGWSNFRCMKYPTTITNLTAERTIRIGKMYGSSAGM